jgi:hypothetical protein
VKEMMFEFLDTFCPDVYLLRTKFGLIPRYEDARYIRTLCNFFSCESDYGLDIYKQWLNSKPIYVYVENSTNDYTLVRESNFKTCMTFSNDAGFRLDVSGTTTFQEESTMVARCV